MRYFRQVMSGIDVQPLLASIAEHPELFGQHSAWTAGKPETVLSQMGMAENYIELRYNKSPAGAPAHPQTWNRSPFHVLIEAQKLVFDLMAAVRGEILGRVIISKMAPGDVIRPHVHEVQFGLPPIFDTYQVPLQVDPGVVFRCGDEDCYMEPGTAWTFPNQVEHAVYNNSTRRDRISMMVDIRPFTAPVFSAPPR